MYCSCLDMVARAGVEPTANCFPLKKRFSPAVFPVFRSQNPAIVTHLCPICAPFVPLKGASYTYKVPVMAGF